MRRTRIEFLHPGDPHLNPQRQAHFEGGVEVFPVKLGRQIIQQQHGSPAGIALAPCLRQHQGSREHLFLAPRNRIAHGMAADGSVSIDDTWEGLRFTVADGATWPPDGDATG